MFGIWLIKLRIQKGPWKVVSGVVGESLGVLRCPGGCWWGRLGSFGSLWTVLGVFGGSLEGPWGVLGESLGSPWVLGCPKAACVEQLIGFVRSLGGPRVALLLENTTKHK